MKRDYKIYLKDIFSAMESIEKFTADLSFEDFKADDKTVSAVLRKFEIIGEATKQIPLKIRQKYPEIPRKEMAGTRDRLIHSYFGVDFKLIWKTIKKRVPEVRVQIEKIISKEGILWEKINLQPKRNRN